jgi:phage shock protein PspC (stress-responsive transcriptional regulator)
MKKNISINISGIIFHIEEDGYDALKRYLDSIQKYFSSFEDNSEIIADIESRIAEIFLTKLNEGKQIITQEDVKSLIATMGSVSDFKAAEEQEAGQEDAQSNTNQSKSYQSAPSASKQLFRDQNRKILGGVCAGLANYFNVDAVWVRLFFALLTAGWGVGLLIYLIMWIVVPGSYELDEPEIAKKLFRDSERKVLGGVSGGLAAYFGIDIVLVRVLFIVTTIFGGLGLIAYIVLWIVLPVALSLTDKMQMQGEPVTLSNIESNIKKSTGTKDGEEESALTKIVMFPFRLIGMIVTGLGKILTPLVEVIRVGFGILITILGLLLVFTVIITTGILFGLVTDNAIPIHLGGPFNGESLPLVPISRAIPTATAIAGFFGALIPGIMITLLGISAVAKRIVFSNTVGWSIFFGFLFSVAVLSATVPKIVYDFKEDAKVKIENTYPVSGKTIVLNLREAGLDEYDMATLSLKGYDEKEIKLVQNFESQGRTRKNAMENAGMIEYGFSVEDSVFTFDSNISFKDDAIFRAQRLHMTMYIPYHQKFVLSEDMWRLLSQYFDRETRDGNTWEFTPDGLTCLTCPEKKEIELEDSKDDNVTNNDRKTMYRSTNFSDFNEVHISGMFDARLTQGERYGVELIGPDDEKRKYSVSQEGNTLLIEYDDDSKITFKNPVNFEKMRINITMPTLAGVELKGAGKTSIRNFNTDDLEIEATGAINVTGDLKAKNITVQLTGACEFNLSGDATTLDAKITGASQLKAYDFTTRYAVVEVNGASSAKVYVTKRLEISEGIASKVSYRGDPDEVIRE